MTYYANKEVVRQFLNECCFRQLGYMIKSSLLYREWLLWLKLKGMGKTSQNDMALRLRELGIAKKRTMHGWHYLDIKFK